MLCVLFVFVGLGSISFAQESQENSLTTKYLGGTPNPVLKNSQTDNLGHWYYQIGGKFERSLDADVFLVLQKSKEGIDDTYYDLCHFAPGGGNTRAFNYPDCPGGPINGISTTLFLSGYNYVAYLSDTSKGLNSDENGILIYFDNIPIIDENNLVTFSDVEFVNNSYFKITGNVSESVTGDVTLKAVGSNSSNADTIAVVIGSISSSGNFVFSEDVPLVPSFESYTIQAFYNNQLVGNYVYTNGSVNTATTTGGSNYDPFADSQVVQDVKSGTGLVQQGCGYSDGPNGWKMCGFADFVSLIQRIIEYIFVLILPIAAIVFAYAGFLFITSGGDPNKRKAAKNAMTKLVIGIVVVMLAWLIVKLVLKTLGVTDGFTMFLDIG